MSNNNANKPKGYKPLSKAMPTMGPDTVMVRHIATVEALDRAMQQEIKALKRDAKSHHAHVEYKPSVFGIIFGKGGK